MKQPKDTGKNSAPKTLVRSRFVTVTVLAIFATALMISFIFCNTFICYAVSYEGTELGQVGSRSELISAISSAEEVASDILGEECSLADSLTVTADIGISSGSADELTDMLLENVDGITKRYAITVDGTPVGTLDSIDELSAILDDILASYSTDNTVSAAFSQDVAIEYTFVSDDLENNAENIKALLSPENVSSEFALTVETADVTDVFSPIDYTTEYQYDDEKYSDEMTVLQTGKTGDLLTSSYTKLENGVEVSSIVTGTYVITAPVSEIILVGSKPGSRTDSTGSYIWPAEGMLTSDYGYRSVAVGSSNHKGIDIAGTYGSDVCAADGGTATFAQYWDGSGYGKIIMIEHDNGDVTYYAHLSEILVSAGDKVAQGDVIGKMGNTGNVSGTHLHFEVRPNGGEPVDPLAYLPER